MDKIEERAWELLEAECGRPLPFDVPTHAALSAIRAALAQQPAAVDEADAKLALANDISRVFGNTNKAMTDYLWSLGYRKIDTKQQEPTT